MTKIFKQLGRHWAACLAVVALLIVQAYCDLSLPDYTSKIVDTGIQQGGIESPVPDTVRSTTLQALELLMSEDDAALADEAYTDPDADGMRTLNPDADTAALENAFTTPDVVLYMAAAKNAATAAGATDTVVPTAYDLDAVATQLAAASQAPGAREMLQSQLTDGLAQLDETVADSLSSQAMLLVALEYDAQGIAHDVQMSYLLRTGGQMLALTLLMVAVAVAVGFIASRVSAAIGRDLRRDVFRTVVGYSNAEIEKFSTASLITRTTNDIQQVQFVCVILLRMVAYAPILGIGGIMHVASGNTGLEWIIFVAVAALLALIAVLMNVAMPKFKQMQVLVDRLNLVSREILTGIMPIRAFSREAFEEKRFDRANTDLMKIKAMKVDGFKVEVLPIIYYKNTSLEKAIERLFVEADRAYREGANILILSDRGIDENHVPIPSLLAVSALQQHLVKTKKRTAVAMILESGEPREVHHFATLLGYGACAINPYLAQDTVKQLVDEHMLDKDYYAAVQDYNAAILNGIVKIASKMGISTIQSYEGSKIFEAIGINKDVIDKYFTNTVSPIGGITLEDIADDVNELHSAAYDPLGLETDLTLDSRGRHKMRSGADPHLYNPATIHLLQEATKRGDYELFKQYTELVNKEEREITLRGLMDFNYPKKGVPLEEVESVDSIVTRFKTGAMSYGSISKEAHETLAIAMNRLHGKSNSGEGGEDADRLASKNSPVNRCSAIKQVASGRFGVTSEYLVSAQEIQIKMAQGAKPGEGGHLPGNKGYPAIAATRLSTPGVSLISPPPHHDIYSIEDLEQLIFDLKNANRDARITVKLVSEAGVGTVAAGVAKAGAQVVLISGYDGGTGAAPSSSIHNAGLPWELGLAETHQTLIMNGLRNKVRIETDGKLMSGRDVATAALLGAEEFGFATAPLVTLGCVMMRVCNLDTCPAGIATQNPELRKRFAGKPEYVENFMRFIAQDLREYMAKLGCRTIDEMVGRSDLLKVREDLSGRDREIDLSNLLNNPFAGPKEKITFDPKHVYDFELEKSKDVTVLLKQLKGALEQKQRRSIDVEVTNTDRSFGTIFGSEITKKYGGEGLPEDTFIVKCNGAGGQSFGAFIPKGLTLELVGDSNDYFGKGLSGGKLVVYAPAGVKYEKDENIIIGNVALYGATSGKAFISGVAGERFCVRNSGASAVVEGVGDHGCEYMTGGRVVVLGKTGKNFAAGMSGGIAYVLDEDNDLYTRMNKEMVFSQEISNKYDVMELKDMIKEHVALTNSEKGKKILDNFSEYLPKFKKVIPYDYNRMLMAIVQMEEKGLSSEQAQIEAFYANTRG